MLPTYRAARLKRAGLVFILTLSTTTILYSLARKEGRMEALRPSPPPTPAPTVFTEPKLTDPRTTLAALLQTRVGAKTPDDKKALSAKLVELALKTHYQSAADGTVSLDAYNSALELRREAGDRRAEADLLHNRAETLCLLGRTTEARADLQNALTISKESVDTALQQAAILQQLGDLERRTGRYRDARTYLDKSLSLRQKSNERNGIADCLRSLGQVSYEEGQNALARRSLEEAVQIYASLGNSQARAAALGQLGDVALAEGALKEAERLYAQGLAIWQEANQDFWIGKFLARQARLLLEEGDLNRADDLANQSLTTLLSSNGPKEAAWARLVLGEVALRRGRTAEGMQHLQRARDEFKLLGSAYPLSLVIQKLKSR